MLARAKCPSALLLTGTTSSIGFSATVAACICWQSAKLPSTTTMRHNEVTFMNRRLSGFIWLVLSFPPQIVSVGCGSGRDEEPCGGGMTPPDSDPIRNYEFEKVSLGNQDKFHC